MTIEYPFVKYFMRIVLNKPWYKLNKRQIYPLTVFPRVNIYQLQSTQQPLHFTHSNRKKLQVDGYLLQAGFVPGNKLSFQLHLQNPKRSEIKKIVATLVQYREVAQTHHSEIIFRHDLPDVHDFSDAQLDRVFSLQIPAVRMAPTYAYMSACFSPSVNVNFNYELKLDVKARGLFTDFTIRVPVIIGTEPMSDHQGLVNTCIEMPPPSAPTYEYDEPPPSYESVVSNIKQ